MKKVMSIKTRLSVALGGLGLLLLITGLIGVIGIYRSNQAQQETYSNQLGSTLALSKFNAYMTRTAMSIEQAVASPGDAGNSDLIAEARQNLATAAKWWDTYTKLPSADSHESDLAEATKAARTTLTTDGIEPLLSLLASSSKPNLAEQHAALTRMIALYKKEFLALTALNNYQGTLGAANYAHSEEDFKIIITAAVLACVLGMIGALASWIMLRRAIAVPLSLASEHFAEISAGNLGTDVKVHANDEMGQLLMSLKQMQTKLADTISSVRTGADSIAAATRDIAEGNLALSARTEQQAAALEESAATMEELTAAVTQNSQNAQAANTLAKNTSDVAGQGDDVIRRVAERMSVINRSAEKITEIVFTIEGLAAQTNILSLNAAVEAARAGEQGKGFAVVAQEVRNLSQRSSAAAKEIKQLAAETVSSVKSGSELVVEAGDTMNRINTSVDQVTALMNEIAAASAEQSLGISQAGLAIAQMDQVTQQNAALVEEAAAAATSLESQAAALRWAVGVFRLPDPRASGFSAGAAANMQREPAGGGFGFATAEA